MTKLSIIAFLVLICSTLLMFLVSRIKEKYEK